MTVKTFSEDLPPFSTWKLICLFKCLQEIQWIFPFVFYAMLSLYISFSISHWKHIYYVKFFKLVLCTLAVLQVPFAKCIKKHRKSVCWPIWLQTLSICFSFQLSAWHCLVIAFIHRTRIGPCFKSWTMSMTNMQVRQKLYWSYRWVSAVWKTFI